MSTPSFVLGQRAVRETLRTPDSLVPTLFIPLFFLVVNDSLVNGSLTAS